MKSRVEPGTSGLQYFLRIVAISIILILSNIPLLIARLDASSLLTANIIVGGAAVFLFATIGETLDKKLILVSFRVYKSLLEHGLIEEQYSD